MSMVVNNNLMAANVARNLNAHYSNLATSTQRLSSGLRVNGAADDAAGLAIRELQRADIAAFHQGARNANDAISMIQVADGALGVIDEKLIRMKELAEQAATGTYDSTQRLMIESEYQAMASEITRIANATDFNGIKLLDGNLSSDTHNGSGMTSTGKIKIHFGTGNDSAEDYYYVKIGSCTASSLGVGNQAAYKVTTTTTYTLDGFTYTKDAEGYKDEVGNLVTNTDTTAKLDDPENNGVDIDTTPSVEDWPAGSTVQTQEAAQKALVAINDAITSKDKIRAHLGAMQNRLENTITNINVMAENLQAAESRISDVDVATEMTEFVRNQILTQSAVAMLSQANSLPQMAMQLIGG